MTDPLSPVKPNESEVLIVTGMSGAGRTTASHALEDLGWYVVENIPPELIGTLLDFVSRTPGAVPKLAIAMDVRSNTQFSDVMESLNTLAANGIEYRVLFMDAADEVLVRRFEHGRRPHPLQGDGRIVDGITRERDVLAALKSNADVVLDTTDLNVHALARAINELFSDEGPITLRVNIMSFGFKYGVPNDANFMADVRFIPNPHWVPELRPFTGLDAAVAKFVLKDEGAEEFVNRYAEMLELVFEGYRRENKHYATIAIGCTGGKHRSVAVSEELSRRLRQLPGLTVNVTHRDLGRE
ncbi:RNase adapter RapZ [Micrococcoides hystricis]|uniref:RNase adapter RapZ n=1 Tax=Micrococcoides hystricis TaxID=1572761 RepID=A0ABV6P746_9MICC